LDELKELIKVVFEVLMGFNGLFESFIMKFWVGI